MMDGLRRYWFLFGLLAATGLAFLWPDGAVERGWLDPGFLSRLAVAGIFFARGLLLPVAEMLRGMAAWRLHLLTQAYLFVVFPLVVLLLLNGWERFGTIPADLRLAFFFLAVLPTTISTAVVYTSQAGGNTAGAVFNATGSNLLGVLLTPAWIAWYLAAEAEAFPLAPVMAQIALLLVAPLLLGQAIRRLIGSRVAIRTAFLETISNVLLLLIIYLAFAGSVLDGIWQKQDGRVLAGVLLACAVLYVLFQAGAAGVARTARLAKPDSRAFLFCASQKTLAAGAPMASILFAGHPALPVILLPVLAYHFYQLIGGSLLVAWIRKKPRA